MSDTTSEQIASGNGYPPQPFPGTAEQMPGAEPMMSMGAEETIAGEPADNRKKLILAGAGAGIAVLGAAFVTGVVRSKKKNQPAPPPPLQATLQLLPDEWAAQVQKQVEDVKWKPYLAALASAWGLFRAAEVRQL